MKVRYSRRAIGDITAIASYLLERSPAGALAVDVALRKSIRLLAEFPRSGRILNRRPHVRVMPLARYPYLIFYTVDADGLLILHVRHAARAPIEGDQL